MPSIKQEAQRQQKHWRYNIMKTFLTMLVFFILTSFNIASSNAQFLSPIDTASTYQIQKPTWKDTMVIYVDARMNKDVVKECFNQFEYPYKITTTISDLDRVNVVVRFALMMSVDSLADTQTYSENDSIKFVMIRLNIITVEEDYFKTVLLHEVGHAFGLKHTYDYDDVMYPVYNAIKTKLTINDKYNFYRLYGRQLKIE